jgi:predicted phage terminase large subunit-like protein
MNVADLANLNTEQAARLYSAMKNDYETFARVCMSHIVKEVPEFHKRMYKALNHRYENNGFVIFRGGSKSTLSKTIQCTSDICFAREPFTLMISESIDQASKDLISIADEIENNEVIHGLFGKLEGERWNKEEIETANGAFLKVKGYGSRLRGLKWKSMRVTKMILDDYESEYNTGTSAQRQAVKDWVDRQVIPAGVPGRTTYQYFGTIVHKDSHLASIKGLPSFAPPNGFYMEVPVEKDGVSAWPSRFPLSYIKAKEKDYKSKGSLSSWLQEMYHIPARSGRMFFNTALIQEIGYSFHKVGYITYLQDPVDFRKIPCNVYVGVDPAISLMEGSDHTIIAVIAVIPDGSKIILDIIVDKLTPTKQRDKVLAVASAYSPSAITIETQGYQGALEDIVREKMSNTKEYYSIRSFKSNKSKNNKWIEGLEPDINSGKFFYLTSANGIDILLKEAEAYNKEDREHDDTLDGLFLANLDASVPSNFDVDKAIRDLARIEKEGRVRKKKPLNYMLY